MTLKAAKRLKKKMPWKQIYFDTIHNCYRLIDPVDYYEYRDAEGKNRKRLNPENLILIRS